MRKPVVGVMGASNNDALSDREEKRLKDLACDLGAALARHDCILITGATTGLPDLVARAFRKHGGFALGISPAENRADHLGRYGLPEEGADVIIYTGFGYKGRNVVNIRSADIVIIFGGATGTLNEFTIAYDEGKIIGVLQGSGGVADHIKEIIGFCKKPTRGTLVFEKDPDRLVQKCLVALNRS
ncbi:MAG: LOG family protein [Deltaproteobacteria bacterium]|nr:LOG family protein [Deltaproteobacteria bacterium]MBI3063508.1 LOG family protein [Deltaproteobacteria bacterium]